jgi:hypothetical protein
MDKELVFIVFLLLIIPASLFAAFASPSIELTRQSQIDVATDTEGIIELKPNNQYDIVQIENSGLLSISPDNMGLNSINANMELFIGDINNPQSDYAFTITNLASEPISTEISIEPDSSYTGQNNNIKYYIETNTGVEQINTEESVVIPIQSGERIYVSVSINSTDLYSGNLDTTMKIIGERL